MEGYNQMKNLTLFNTKNLHIVILIVGIIFISLSVFHSNLWFDESYSVSLAEHSYTNIWKIGGNDVHPILYYWILHTLKIIFGSSIVIYRVFSALCIALLGLLGFTHIRKDYGEKTGLIFSFLAYFLPVSSLYAGEIRMYALGLLLGTIMAIYAYRIYKNQMQKTTFFIFTLSSISLAYTHYYGLMLAGIINLLIFFYLIKNRDTRKEDLKKFVVGAIFQVLLYIPWLICFLTQIKNVSNGFWITLKFPETIYEILALHFQGNLSQDVGLLLVGIIYTYVGYSIFKAKKEEKKPALWALGIYLGIIVIAWIISIIMPSPILLYRYLIIISGLFIFTIAFFIAQDKKIIRVILINTIIFTISVASNISLIKENYNSENNTAVEFIKEKIKNEDIIIYSNAINGAVITTKLAQEKNNISYFYNKDNWGVHEAYKAFSPNMKIEENLTSILDNYEGNIWIIEGKGTKDLKEEIASKYDIKTIEEKQFHQSYKNYDYTIEYIEK